MAFDFVTKFKKSKHGIDEALKEINETILLSIGQVLNEKHQSFNSVIAVQLRNLLYEGKIQHINSDLKLLKFKDKWLEFDIHSDDIVCYRDSDLFEGITEKISLSDWLNQKLIYIKRNNSPIPDVIYDSSFLSLVDKIKKADKEILLNAFEEKECELDGEKIMGYTLKSSINQDEIEKVVCILDTYGYNNITVSEYIKLIADKTGAHLDIEWPVGLMMIHNDQINYIIPIALYISQLLTDYLRAEGLIMD